MNFIPLFLVSSSPLSLPFSSFSIPLSSFGSAKVEGFFLNGKTFLKYFFISSSLTLNPLSRALFERTAKIEAYSYSTSIQPPVFSKKIDRKLLPRWKSVPYNFTRLQNIFTHRTARKDITNTPLNKFKIIREK